MQKITIHSYRGGTGKSLIALNLCHHLKLKGNRVLFIETDVQMPSLQEILNMKAKKTFNMYYEGKCQFEECIYPSTLGISVLCCSSKFSFSDKTFVGDKNFHQAKLLDLMENLTNLESQYDYCIIDSAPGYGFIQMNNALLADLVFLVLRSGKTALSGTLQMIKQIYSGMLDLGKKISVIWNQIPNVENFQKYLNTWENKIKDAINPEFFHHLYYDDNVICDLAEGNHILIETRELYDNISKIAEKIKKSCQ